VLPLNLPADGGTRVVDCFGYSGKLARRRFDLGPVADWHQKIIDQVVEVNETVMDHYLDLGEDGLLGQELHDAFEQCLREGHLVPVCFVSARSGAASTTCCRSPANCSRIRAKAIRRTSCKGIGDDATPIDAQPDPSAHVIADVFKIVNDPFVGKLGIFRVYQGTVKKDSQLFIDDGKKPFKVAHLFKIKGKDHVEIAQAVPGDNRGGGARSTTCTSTRCCTIRTTKTRSTWRRAISRGRCSAWRWKSAHKGQEQKLPPRCTSWPKKIPRSRSNIIASSTKPSCAACRTCTCA
jgi:translation elongation factor EF-G